jgi:hypothetical protein
VADHIKALKDAVKKAESDLDDAERDYRLAKQRARQAWDEHFELVAKAMEGDGSAKMPAQRAKVAAQIEDKYEAQAEAVVKKAKSNYAKAELELGLAEMVEAMKKACDKIKKTF